MKKFLFLFFFCIFFALLADDSPDLVSDKYYVNDIIDVYSGESTLVERNYHTGDWFQSDPNCTPGRHPYYNYEPVFDSEGNWVDETQVDTGDYREVRIVAGPFDSEEACHRFIDRGGISQERSSGSGNGGPGVTMTQYGDGTVSITTGSGSVDLQPGSELIVVTNGDGSRTYHGTDSNGNDFTFTVNSDGSSQSGGSSSSSLPVGINSFIVPSGSGSGSGEPGSGSGSGEPGSGSGSGESGSGSGSGSGWSNSPPEDNPMVTYEYSQGGTTLTGYTDGSFSFSTNDRTVDLQPGSELTTTNYSDGSRVVSGTDSNGNDFTVTILPDGSVREGGMPEGGALADLGITATTSGSVTIPSAPVENPYDGEPDLNDVISGSSGSSGGDMSQSWSNDSSGSGSGDQPGGDQPGGDQPGGDQPGGDQPGGDQPGGDQPGGDQPGDVHSGYVSTHMASKSPFVAFNRSFSSSALTELKRKLVPDLSSFSGGGDSDIVLHVPLQFLSYDFSFDVGPMRSACGGALLPLMSFSRSVSIFLFAFVFVYGIVRALRQW